MRKFNLYGTKRWVTAGIAGNDGIWRVTWNEVVDRSRSDGCWLANPQQPAAGEERQN